MEDLDDAFQTSCTSVHSRAAQRRRAMFRSLSVRFRDKNSFWLHKCPNPGGHLGPLSAICSRTPPLAF